MSNPSRNLQMNESFQVDISNYDPGINTFIVNKMMDSHSPSLVAAIIRDNNIIWAQGYGEQPELDRIYMIASITKVFTAVALLQLIEQGKSHLDDNVNDYLPFSFRNPLYPEIPITFRMLLSHTSSVGGYSDDLEFHMYSDALEKLSLYGFIPDWLPYPEWFSEYFLENGSLYESSNWLPYKPGTHWSYSNVGFTLLAYLIEVISEKKINEYVRENIFTPLGMHDTGYNISDVDESKLAIPYNYEFEVYPGTGNLVLPHYNYLSMGSGAIRTTILDLARFSLLFTHAGVSNGTRILSDESINLITSEYLGWLDFGPQWDGHGGLLRGFVSHMFTNLGRGTSVPFNVLVFTNQYNSLGENLDVTYKLCDIAYSIDADRDLFPVVSSDNSIIFAFLLVGGACTMLVISIYLTRSGKLSRPNMEELVVS